MDTATAIGYGIGITLGMLVALGFYPYCLWRVAEKTNQPKKWMAWIPFVNVFLLCRVGAISQWYAVAWLVLASVADYFGHHELTVLSLLAKLLFYWIVSRTAFVLGESTAKRVMAFIPIVNLFYFPYLAFRKEKPALPPPIPQ